MLHYFLPREESMRWHLHPSTQMSNGPPVFVYPPSARGTGQAHSRRGGSARSRPAPLTYGRLWRHVEGVRTLHAMGVGRHDRVALVLPNGPEMAAAFLCVAAGATCAPLNPDYSAHEFAFYLADLRAKALILQAGMDSPARAVAQAHGLRILDLSPIRDAEAGRFTLTGETQPGAMAHGCAQADDVALVLYTTGTTSRPKRCR